MTTFANFGVLVEDAIRGSDRTTSYELGQQSAIDRKSAADEMLADLHRRNAESEARVLEMLDPEQRAICLHRSEEIRSGRHGARSTPRSLSTAPRRAFGMLAQDKPPHLTFLPQNSAKALRRRGILTSTGDLTDKGRLMFSPLSEAAEF